MHAPAPLRSFAALVLALTACGSPPSATTPAPAPRAPRAEVELAPLPWLAEQSPRWTPPETPAVVLRGGTVMTAAGRTIERGVVVLEGGLVRAVGSESEVTIPAGATVVDVTGRFVTPGIIDSHSHMGVYASPGVNATSDGNEATSPVTAEVRAEDSFWPQDPALGRALAAGVTTIQVLPGSANLIGGRGVVMKLHLGRSAAEMRFPEAPDTLKIACGENPKRVYGERHSNPSTRMGNAAGYRRAFQQAVEYARAWRNWQHGQRQWRVKKDAYDAAVRAAAEAGDAGVAAENASDAGTPALPDDPGPEPAPPARDRGLETLVGVIEGRTLVQNHCYRADEMLTMLRIAREFGFHIRSFHHAVEAYKIRDVLAAEDVSVSTWADWWGFKLEAFDSVEQNLALLEQAGVRAIMHSDSPMLIQRLAQEAAKAVRAAEDVGLPPISDDRALRWVTANPAWALGVDRMTGTLEPGKMADVVVWSASPFSVYARAERVYVDGRLAFDRARPDPFAGTDFEIGLTLPEASASLPPAVAAAAPAPAAVPAATLAEPYARRPRGAVFGGALTLVHARVLVGDGTRVDDATLIVRDGRIVSVTAGGAAPAATAEAPVIDATGLTITPGFVGVGHALGLVEIDLEPSTADLAPESDADPIRAAFSAADGYNPSSVLVPVARLGGVTSALSTPQGGLVAGTSAWVDLAGARPDDALVAPVVALHVDLDDGGVEAGGGARPAMLGRFRDALEDARLYASQRAAYERRGLRELSVSRGDLERLAEALSGRVPVVVRVARADDVLRVLALARAYRLRLVLSGVEEGWKVADAIASAGVPCVVQPLANLPERFARLGTRYDNAALLARAGVRLILTTDGPHGLRNLRQEAGNAVADGLDPAIALRALTSEPARVFGLGAEVGTLAPGRVANLAAWTGDPFELRTRLAHLVVRGRALPLRSRQTQLFERYRELGPARRGRAAP